MTDAVQTLAARSAAERRLKRRYAAERRFRLFGVLAIAAALGFLALLLGRIVEQGHTAFINHVVETEVWLDPARIDPAYPAGANYDQLIAEQILARLGVADDEAMSKSAAVRNLMSPSFGFQA